MSFAQKLAVTAFCLVLLAASGASAQLVGTRTIGGSTPDYATIEAAIDDLALQGVGAGGVTFLIRDGVYDENANLFITDLNSSASAPVVFRPDVDATVVINVDLVGDFSWGLRVHNSDHVTFSGLRPGETRGIHMTINGFRNADDDVFVIWISNGSDHVTLENLRVESFADPGQDTGFSTPVYLSTFSVPTPPIGMDDFTLRNAEIVGGSTFGVYLDSEETENHRINIVDNRIWDWQKDGISLADKAVDANLEGNEIFQTFANARSSVFGITMGAGNVNTRVHRNYIHDLRHSEMSGPRGIFFRSDASGTRVYNNIIELAPGTQANSSYCIFQTSGTTGTGSAIYYNTLIMSGEDQRGTDSYALYIASDTSDLAVYNNLMINTRIGDDGSNHHGAVRFGTEAAAATFDHNLMTVGSDSPADNRVIARIGSGVDETYYNTLAALQLAPGYAPRDANSISADPLLSPTVVGKLLQDSPAIGAAMPLTVAGIVTDFDGDARSGVAPDIGADEYIGEIFADSFESGDTSAW